MKTGTKPEAEKGHVRFSQKTSATELSQTLTPKQVHLRKGEGLLFDAKLFHAEVAITRGTRYLLVRTSAIILRAATRRPLCPLAQPLAPTAPCVGWALKVYLPDVL